MSGCEESGKLRPFRFLRPSAAELGIDPATVGEAAAKVKRVDYFVPALGKGAEMLEGSREENIDKLVELMAAKGGLK